MKYGGIKYTVNNTGKYDYVLLTDSIYPINYQLVLVDNYIRKQYFFVEKSKQIVCDEFVNAEVRVSANKKPLQGLFVRPVCFRQFRANANVLIEHGKNTVDIHLLNGGQINELRNPRLFVRAEKFEKSTAYTILKYLHNIFMPLAVIVLVVDLIVLIKSYFK
jgi:hypothetical protein